MTNCTNYGLVGQYFIDGVVQPSVGLEMGQVNSH